MSSLTKRKRISRNFMNVEGGTLKKAGTPSCIGRSSSLIRYVSIRTFISEPYVSIINSVSECIPISVSLSTIATQQGNNDWILNGNTTISSCQILTISISNYLLINNGITLNNNGTIINSNLSTIKILSGGIINNNKGSIFNNNDYGSINNIGTINNNGTFNNNNNAIISNNTGNIKNISGGIINNNNPIDGSFYNSGIITNTNSIIKNNGGIIGNNGTINNNTGTIYNYNNGTIINDDGSTITNNTGTIYNGIIGLCGIGTIILNPVIGNQPISGCPP
jgi:hypothetical protein